MRAKELDPNNDVVCAAVRLAKMTGRRNDHQEIKGPKERNIEDQLATPPVTLTYYDAPLRQVLDDIRAYYNLNIFIDETALADENIALNSPISVTFDQVSLGSALKLLLSGVKLTYVIRDEVLVITTPSAAKKAQHVR
jgi:hypothetical protein